MKRKLEVTELIFKIISYTCLTVFALCCLYPFVYAISASISGREAVEYSRVVLFPQDAHSPACDADGKRSVKKIIGKVKV